MRVLVTGAGGLLGAEVWRVFSIDHELSAIGRHQPPWVAPAQWQNCDLTEPERTYALVTRLNPDLVVHCAAYNNVDGAEARPEDAYRGNAAATRNLALACQRFDTVLLSVSSDYVFDGGSAPEEGYREEDPARPLSRYGESKRWAEAHVERLLNKYFIVRTSWLFGPARPSWVDRVVELARERKPIQALRDARSAPTYTPDLAQAILRLAHTRLFGVYHLTNSGFCSRVELAEEALGLNKLSGYPLLQKLTQADLRLPAPRPVFSGLCNLAWKLNGWDALRPWTQALAEHFVKSQVAL